MNEKRELWYIVAVVAVCIITITAILIDKKLGEISRPIENRVTLEINGKLVLTMTNNCVFIEQTK